MFDRAFYTYPKQQRPQRLNYGQFFFENKLYQRTQQHGWAHHQTRSLTLSIRYELSPECKAQLKHGQPKTLKGVTEDVIRVRRYLSESICDALTEAHFPIQQFTSTVNGNPLFYIKLEIERTGQIKKAADVHFNEDFDLVAVCLVIMLCIYSITLSSISHPIIFFSLSLFCFIPILSSIVIVFFSATSQMFLSSIHVTEPSLYGCRAKNIPNLTIIRVDPRHFNSLLTFVGL